MTDQNPKPQSTFELRRNLTILSATFKKAAESKSAADMQVSELLAAAAQALSEEQQKNEELQQQLAALQKAQLSKKLKGKNFTFLVDGSGSMGSMGNMRCGSIPLLELAMGSIENFSCTTGAKVASALWGSSQVVTVTAENAEKLKKESLLSGSDFAPAMDYMATAAEKHFVVISDGDIFDADQSLAKASAFLKTNPKASLDFIVMRYQREETWMEKFALQLQQEFPAQVQLTLVKPEKQLLDNALVTTTLQRAPKPRKKAQPQPKP